MAQRAFQAVDLDLAEISTQLMDIPSGLPCYKHTLFYLADFTTQI